jgi:hypothetical protein
MAVVRYPEGQQRSGSAGGSVYSHNRFGQYIRTRSIPVNPATDRQVAARNRVQNLTIAWGNTLTQAQRDAWEEYAANVPWQNALGDTAYLTGLNHYLRSNAAKLQAGLARVDDAPTIFNLAQAELALVCNGSNPPTEIEVEFDDTQDWASEDLAAQIVSMGIPKNPSIAFFNGPWRFATALLGNSTTPITSPQTVTTPWTYSVGQRVWVRTRILRADGRLSEFAQVNFLA